MVVYCSKLLWEECQTTMCSVHTNRDEITMKLCQSFPQNQNMRLYRHFRNLA